VWQTPSCPFVRTTRVGGADHEVTERYGVWVEWSRHGRRGRGNSRTTVVTEAGGVVPQVIPKVSPATDDEEALAATARL